MPVPVAALHSARLTAVLSFTLLLLLALYAVLLTFTVQTWLRFNRSAPWHRAQCSPISSSLHNCSRPPFRYKLSVPVSLHFRSHTLNRTAYYTATPCSFETTLQAEHFQTQLRASPSRTCYLAPNRQQVAFEKPHFHPSRARLRVKAAALTFTLVVFTLTALLYLFLFFQYVRSKLRHSLFDNPSHSPSIPITRPHNAHLPALTPTTPATFSHSDFNLAANHWSVPPPHQNYTCAVCLEDITSHTQPAVIHLPCSHYFHQPCVTRWWKISKPTCPYCNHDLTNDFIKLKNSLADTSPHAAPTFDSQVDHSIRARRYVRTFGILPS